jgi:hypothetical protein
VSVALLFSAYLIATALGGPLSKGLMVWLIFVAAYAVVYDARRLASVSQKDRFPRLEG